jgi:hypothetical protein
VTLMFEFTLLPSSRFANDIGFLYSWICSASATLRGGRPHKIYLRLRRFKK